MTTDVLPPYNDPNERKKEEERNRARTAQQEGRTQLPPTGEEELENQDSREELARQLKAQKKKTKKAKEKAKKEKKKRKGTDYPSYYESLITLLWGALKLSPSTLAQDKRLKESANGLTGLSASVIFGVIFAAAALAVLPPPVNFVAAFGILTVGGVLATGFLAYLVVPPLWKIAKLAVMKGLVAGAKKLWNRIKPSKKRSLTVEDSKSNKIELRNKKAPKPTGTIALEPKQERSGPEIGLNRTPPGIGGSSSNPNQPQPQGDNTSSNLEEKQEEVLDLKTTHPYDEGETEEEYEEEIVFANQQPEGENGELNRSPSPDPKPQNFANPPSGFPTGTGIPESERTTARKKLTEHMSTEPRPVTRP